MSEGPFNQRALRAHRQTTRRRGTRVRVMIKFDSPGPSAYGAPYGAADGTATQGHLAPSPGGREASSCLAPHVRRTGARQGSYPGSPVAPRSASVRGGRRHQPSIRKAPNRKSSHRERRTGVACRAHRGRVYGNDSDGRLARSGGLPDVRSFVARSSATTAWQKSLATTTWSCPTGAHVSVAGGKQPRCRHA